MAAKEEKKSRNKILEEKLFYKKESAWCDLPDHEHKKIFSFCENYKKFIEESKTERLCVKNIISILEKSGFKNINGVKSVKKGDRVYRLFKGKTLVACVAGDNMESFRLIGSHVDSPRLDLKPAPLYQNSELALLESHYYGGIKKFHWVNVPLEMHGIIYTKGGDEVTLNIGSGSDDPKFIIPRSEERRVGKEC